MPHHPQCPPVKMLPPRTCKEAVLSKCCTSRLERPVSLCKSGPEKCKTSFTDFSLAEMIQIWNGPVQATVTQGNMATAGCWREHGLPVLGTRQAGTRSVHHLKPWEPLDSVVTAVGRAGASAAVTGARAGEGPLPGAQSMPPPGSTFWKHRPRKGVSVARQAATRARLEGDPGAG